MNRINLISIFAAGFVCLLNLNANLRAADLPGVPRDSNFNNTGGYDATRIVARLNVNVAPGTKVVHFIRDNNDPRVVTKTYLLQHVDPYEFRDYLRQMVQTKRVGNSMLQQQYPSNTAAPPFLATESSVELGSANAQPGYAPPVQLGSNTAVECLKYADGTGLLIVSAEEYRFGDSENGIGIDTLVATLDDPALGALNYGYQMYIYMPKFVPARNLMPLIENVGMNINDATEVWQGMDLVAYDPDLNWLIFDVCNYSCDNIAHMLAKFDVPVPQVRLKIKVYELDTENDDRIGIDFQSWKNNEGADFFSVGGRYRNNWSSVYSGGVGPVSAYGSERTSYFNFNPKWNTRYIDFLESRGKAKVLHTGELCIRNAAEGATFARTTQMLYSDDSAAVSKATATPDMGVGPYQLLSQIINKVFDKGDPLPVGKGEAQVIRQSVHGIRVHHDREQRLRQPRGNALRRHALEHQPARIPVQRRAARLERRRGEAGRQPAARQGHVRDRRPHETGGGRVAHGRAVAHGHPRARVSFQLGLQLGQAHGAGRDGAVRMGRARRQARGQEHHERS